MLEASLPVYCTLLSSVEYAYVNVAVPWRCAAWAMSLHAPSMTVICAESCGPSLVAATTMVTPGATPVTRPSPFTDATEDADDVHVTVARPVESPVASSAAALSCSDP